MTQNQHHYRALYKKLICHPEGKHYKKLGKVGWLMMYLLVKADDSGVFEGSSEQIAEEMGIYVITVRAWLRHLERNKYIKITGGWKNMKIIIQNPKFTDYAQKIAQKEKSEKNLLDSSADEPIVNDNRTDKNDIQNNDKINNIKRNDRNDEKSDRELVLRGRESIKKDMINKDKNGDDFLKIAKKLTPEFVAKCFDDEDNIAFYEFAFRTYPKKMIRQAFVQAQKFPTEKIKRSRGALFNYILRKLYEKSK